MHMHVSIYFHTHTCIYIHASTSTYITLTLYIHTRAYITRKPIAIDNIAQVVLKQMDTVIDRLVEMAEEVHGELALYSP